MRSQGFVGRSVLVLSLAVLMAGCQTLETKKHTQSFDQQFASGDYPLAADAALQAGEISAEGESDDLLWSLQAGAALTASGRYDFSNKVLDGAETLMKADDNENIAKRGFEKVTSVLLNGSFNGYTPTVYDGVMTNTYKALNNILLGDWQNARIELNRAADRQRRAEEHFKEKIKEQQAKLDEQEKERQQKAEQAAAKTPQNKGFSYDRSYSASEQAIYDKYPELAEWAVYPDFVNPYTDYLHGLYFFLASQDKSDYGKSRQSLRRVAGMVPDNKAVAVDLKVADNLRQGKWAKKRLSPAVWVVFENGQAPQLKETLIPLPLFLVSNKIDYTQIALPKLEAREQAYPHLDIFNGKKKLARTEQLASIDRVIQTEFKKEFPYKVTEAVASTLTKAFIQYKIQEEAGVLGSLAGIVYQAATTHADTRSWSALPKEVQVARVRKPNDNKLQLKAPGLAEAMEIELPDDRFSIVFVKASSPQSKPVFQVVGFDA
ncbi:COG3014 family protein [Marinobacterium arenosum]|uniref:COG3014 family protein n=1 Tax=Marinobacterium arenosum TaxID=2862496 RepID=UPI001C9868C1|nr:hypothetical protein [Marinobacterium arenosum]MBY4675522.1 hypothetical protein [Marinobacterium arenosum]